MIAVIQTGGKQFTVKENDTIQIEKVLGKEGDTVKFDAVLLTAEEDGKALKIGNPILSGVTVSGKILKQARTRKIRIVKFKQKVHYRRTQGHRQHFSLVQITKIA
ncbi:MAG: hypothetical protein ACD_43C00052G0003 [uncultured bacterium]|nr:MAG: hypothetical protein ACD_43C00052G0003 [uncultured bacterium]